MPNLTTCFGGGVQDRVVLEQTHDGAGAPGQRGGRTFARGAFVAAVVAVLAVTGCSSSTTSSTSTTPSTTASTTPSTSASAVVTSGSAGKSGSSTTASYPADKQQICQARDQLQTSITALTSGSLLKGGTTAIKAAVDQVKTDVDAVAAAGKQDYKPQITALQSSVQQLETAVGALGNGSAASSITAVAAAIAATGTAAADLFTELKTACGS